MKRDRSILLALAFVASAVGFGQSATACNVPVFRYALEQWPSDTYEVIVFHEGPLTDDQQTLVAELEDQKSYGAYYVRTVDLADEPEKLDVDFHKGLGTDVLPWVAVRYPRSYEELPPALSGPFSKETFDTLFDSPMRREIARRILKGDSVVWLLVESGNAKKDAAAKKMLEERLPVLSKKLKLPELTEEDMQYMQADAGPTLRIAFTSLSVSRSNPEERLFLQLLDVRNPPDPDQMEPMAFAFFGRGRVLGPLYGSSIGEEPLTDTCIFLTGPCSCQIKSLNPGFDMLMIVDWDGVIDGEFTLAEALPRLTSASVVAATSQALAETLADKGRGNETPTLPVSNALGNGTLKSSDPFQGTARLQAQPDDSDDNAQGAGTPVASTVMGSQDSYLVTVGAVLAVGIIFVLLGGMVVSRRQSNSSKSSV